MVKENHFSKKTYYDILGVSYCATQDQIKKAFRSLALKLHPDKNADNQNYQISDFHLISKAYQVLSCSKLRSKYDYYVLRVHEHEKQKNQLYQAIKILIEEVYKTQDSDENEQPTEIVQEQNHYNHFNNSKSNPKINPNINGINKKIQKFLNRQL